MAGSAGSDLWDLPAPFTQIGPITKTVTDGAIVLSAIAGHDEQDATSVNVSEQNYTDNLTADLKGLKIGVPQEYFVEGMQQDVKDNIITAIKRIQELGAEIDWNVTLPHTKYALAAYYIIAPSEASANLARYDGFKYGFSYGGSNMWEALEKTKQTGFGAEVKPRIMLGTYAPSSGHYGAHYLQAQKVRTLIRRGGERALWGK